MCFLPLGSSFRSGLFPRYPRSVQALVNSLLSFLPFRDLAPLVPLFAHMFESMLRSESNDEKKSSTLELVHEVIDSLVLSASLFLRDHSPLSALSEEIAPAAEEV